MRHRIWCLKAQKKIRFFSDAMEGDEVLPPPPPLVESKNYRLAVKFAVSNLAPAMLSRARLAAAKKVYNSSDE